MVLTDSSSINLGVQEPNLLTTEWDSLSVVFVHKQLPPHLELNDTKAVVVIALGSSRILWRSMVNSEAKEE